MNIKQYIPWQLKIIAKLILSRLPLQYELWNRFNLFRHGDMEQPSYAYGVFKKHFDRAKPRKGFVSLELGPGNSLFSAIISAAFGGTSSFLIDVGKFASEDVKPYQQMVDFLIQRGLPSCGLPSYGVNSVQSLDEVLTCCHATYLTGGLSSLREVASQSVDFIWSHAVLEHIKRSDFLDVMKELRRIIREDGICSHEVDLRDHLSGALNNLRFSEKIWESNFMSSSGFYTNRIQYSYMVEIFKQAEFDVELINKSCWNELPTPRAKLNKEFSHLSDDELCISTFAILLKPI